MFTSTETPLGFAFQSATGKMPLYIYKGDKLLGMLTTDEAGHLLAVNESGYKIGEIAEGAVIRDIQNKKLGIWRDGQIYTDWKATEPIKAEPAPSGLVMTKDPASIGKYYAGQKEYDQATKTMLTIDKGGMLVDDAGKVVGQAKPKAVGYFPEGTDISSLKTGQTIGQIKAQPTFVIIYNNGVQQLPAWAAKANTIEEMEKRAWQLFESDKYSGDLYEGFKKYAIFMENEGVLPKDTAIIPVLDDKGKPVILWTRSPSGKKIAVPVMQLASEDWFGKSLQLTRDLSGRPTSFKPFTTAGEALRKVANFPQESAEAYLNYMRANSKDVGWYGGIVEGLGTHDIDIFARDPTKAAKEIYQVIDKSAKPNRQVYLEGSHIGMVKDGVVVKIADVQPLSRVQAPLGRGLMPFETRIIDGVRVQTPQSELTRLFSRMAEEFGGKGYARWDRLARAMGGDVDLGIGAKPPTLRQLIELKARGVWNTVRDIFVQGLEKKTKLATVGEVAPDLEPDAKALFELEDRLAESQRAYKTALTAAGRSAASITEARKELDRLTTEYQGQLAELRDRLYTRALELDQISQRLPPRASEGDYRALIENSAFERRGRAPQIEETAAREEVRERATRTTREEPRALREERGERAERTERTERAPREERVERPERTVRSEQLRIPRIPPPPPRPPRTPRLSEVIPGNTVKRVTEKRLQEFAGALTWYMGELKGEGGRLEPQYWAIKAPFNSQDDVGHFNELPPNAIFVEGGPEAAYRSIQTITGKAPEKLAVDLGIMDILISSPTKKPGKPGAIKFVKDVKQTTTGDITIGPRRPKVTKGTVEESLTVNPPLGSSKMPAAVAAAIGSYKGKVTPEGKVVVKVRRL